MTKYTFNGYEIKIDQENTEAIYKRMATNGKRFRVTTGLLYQKNDRLVFSEIGTRETTGADYNHFTRGLSYNRSIKETDLIKLLPEPYEHQEII